MKIFSEIIILSFREDYFPYARCLIILITSWRGTIGVENWQTLDRNFVKRSEVHKFAPHMSCNDILLSLEFQRSI